MKKKGIISKLKDGFINLKNELTGKNAYDQTIDGYKRTVKAFNKGRDAVLNKSKSIPEAIKEVKKSVNKTLETKAILEAEGNRDMVRKMYIASGIFGVAPVAASTGLSLYQGYKSDKQLKDIDVKLKNLIMKHEQINFSDQEVELLQNYSFEELVEFADCLNDYILSEVYPENFSIWGMLKQGAKRFRLKKNVKETGKKLEEFLGKEKAAKLKQSPAQYKAFRTDNAAYRKGKARVLGAKGNAVKALKKNSSNIKDEFNDSYLGKGYSKLVNLLRNNPMAMSRIV